MLLFSLLLTFCLAVSAESSLDGTSLLGTIRKDPNALVKIFDTATADKDKLQKLKDLVGTLVNETLKEIQNIKNGINKTVSLVNKSQEALTKAVALETTLFDAHDRAKEKVGTAQGKYDAIVIYYNRESPVLTKEITVFNTIITILKNLLNGKDLVEEESEQVKAFISFTEQADPVKVQRVLGVIIKLRKASVDELNVLESKLSRAKENLGNSTKAMDHAFGEWDAAKKDTELKTEARDTAGGTFRATAASGKKRLTKLNKEIEDLQWIIGELNLLKATESQQ